jgi:dihydroneopterin triphosphate diphosphatase
MPIRCTMVSVVTVRDSGETLLLRRSAIYLQGVWSYVAGHLRPGEAGWQCALRELHEETALVPHALYSADFCEQYYDPRHEVIELVPAFVARVDNDSPVILNHEHDRACWLNFDAAMEQLPFGAQRRLFAHVRAEFVERTPRPALRLPPGD